MPKQSLSIDQQITQIHLEQKEILKRNGIVVRNSNDLNKLPPADKKRFAELAIKEYELKEAFKKYSI